MAEVEFQMLDSSDPPQRSLWLETWESWPQREAFAHPAYASLMCREGDRAMCATLRASQGCVLFPVIVRPLEREPWAKALAGICDITTPYGYGGPFFWGCVDDSLFWDGFEAWAATVGAATCFARLSLFPEQILPFRGDVGVRNQNVVRSLGPSLDEIWMDYEHKVRKNVNRATRERLEVVVDESGQRLEQFVAVYLSTLQRREADEEYFFSGDFFRSLLREMGDAVVFFHVLRGDEVISSELILVSAENIYSFLGGTCAAYFPLRPNDLLKHEVVRWGRERGKKRFVLGGGYQGLDGIFRYKRAFAPSGVVPFRVGTWVLNEAVNRELMSLRASWEARHGRPWAPRPAFFPEYRA